MSAPVGHDIGRHVALGQRQIAHQIEDLVPDAFVTEAQFIAEGSAVAKDQQIAVA